MSQSEIPQKLKAFVTLGFDYTEKRLSGLEAYANCMFCQAHNKLFVNIQTGQWDCKVCQLRGNFYTFMKEWYEVRRKEQTHRLVQLQWKILEEDRKLPIAFLKSQGVIFAEDKWFIPVRNAAGSITNFRTYTKGHSLHGLAEMESALFGADGLAEAKGKKELVYVCEGEWDALAMRHLLEKEGENGIVVGTPGAGVWKDAWTQQLLGMRVICCYDNDASGLKGVDRVYSKTLGKIEDFRYIKWPEPFEKGFDIRDFVTKGGTFSELTELMSEYVSDEKRHEQALEEHRPAFDVSSPERPNFEDLIKVFSQHLHMTPDMVIGLRIIMSVVLSNQIQGDPLWVHIVSPPGTAKTELLMPLSECANCYFASTLTAHSLVSGFSTAGGGDPSLLPKLNGKTFILKDFTEILGMPRNQKDEIYSTLRGAYDGSVQKPYGNGMIRDYKVRFNMICGVTHSIFGERGASLGERFLLFHLVKGVGFNSGDAIRAAIKNVGKESAVRQELIDTVRKFVDVFVSPEDVPDIPQDCVSKIVALSTIVAMLRATVERNYQSGGGDKILYRPQHEMGTRLGKQLTKLAYGLSLVNSPPEFGDKEYNIVKRVALDTCVGFNLEVIQYLVNHPRVAVEEICEALSIPMSTLRDQLDDLCMLGAISREKMINPHGKGAPRYLYAASKVMSKYWRQAKLENESELPSALPKSRIKVVKQNSEGNIVENHG